MTPEKLHEAIGQLPADLIAEADEKRNQRPRTASRRRQFAAMVACFAVILACSLFLTRMGMGGSTKGASTEMAQAAPEAPAAAAPEYSLENATPEEAGEDQLPAENAAGDALRDESAASVAGAPETASEASAITTDVGLPAQFALGLLQASHKEGQNTLISPLSAFSGLAMTAQGADGRTLRQMEDVLTMPADDMGSWLCTFWDDPELRLANSIWMRNDDRLMIDQSFMDAATEAFRAELFWTSMGQDTCDAINAWVREKTDGMIPSIVNEVPEDAMVYLANALAFEASWPVPYCDYQVTDSIFTTEDGREQEMVLMHSTEHLYLETDTVTGFIKPYKDSRYGFAVLLPKEDVSLRDCLDSLTGEAFQELIRNPADAVVYAALPKFQAEFDTELSEALKSMGMTDAFDANTADFSAMGTCRDGSLYISRVMHKTFLSVGEQGTQAGAATVIEMLVGTAYNPDIKEVTLDRPFIYAIVDMDQGFPIFIGTLEDMSA